METAELINFLTQEIGMLVNSNKDFYGNTNFIVANEQAYINNLEKKENTIYIVVKFLQATMPYGQIVLPFNITAVSEENNIEKCQRLLFDFSQEYNLKNDSTGQIKQFYTTPVVLNNFNVVGKGFRSVLMINATFLISKNILNIDKIQYKKDDGTYEDLEIINFNLNYENQIDTQAFSENGSKCISVGMIGVLSFNISLYFNDNELTNKILDIMFKNGQVNQTFTFRLTFKNGYDTGDIEYKLVNSPIVFNLGELPMASFTFAR